MSTRATLHPSAPHLQDEHKVVDGAVALVEVMLCCLLVLAVILQLLDDIGVLEEPQQDLLGEVWGLEGLHLYWEVIRGCSVGLGDNGVLGAHLPTALTPQCMLSQTQGYCIPFLPQAKGTCSHEAMCRQQELRGDLHLHLAV